MSQDFYIKAQALHEEFQKRELHYLNTERKLRSSMMYKKQLNLSLEEYLQKINQREKETEETYRNIMGQMEKLDRQTDSMTLKLEKLSILQNSLTSRPLPTWSSNVGSNLPIFNTPQDSNLIAKFELIESNIKSTYERPLRSISTQTENFYCEECGFLIHNQPNHMGENALLSSINIQSSINEKLRDIPSTKYEYTLAKIANSQISTSSVNSNVTTLQPKVDKNDTKENYNVEQQINDNFNKEASTRELDEKHHSIESKLKCNNEMIINKSLPETSIGESNEIQNSIKSNNLESDYVVIGNTQSSNAKNEEKITTADEHSETEIYGSKSPDAEATFVSKSDAESMNNEFDFLESDTRNKSSKTNNQNISKSCESPSSDVIVCSDKESVLVVEHPGELSPKPRKIKGVVHPPLDDDKTETSGSVSGPHSPNASLASDSDSIYRKDSPLKASAAYQALLGNTVIPKNIKTVNSESESEDEVENVLASVVQKSNVKSKSSIQPKKDKPTSQTVESKPAVKGSKPLSMHKPQSKLSKNTRKVLGLESSSSSDVESTIKPSEKKIDEDSDEFGFYE